MDDLSKYPLVERLVVDLQAAANAEHASTTTDEIIRDMRTKFDIVGPYQFAKDAGVLINNSGEEFAIQFMSFYNAYSGTSTY
jgi:hypothetical protein